MYNKELITRENALPNPRPEQTYDYINSVAGGGGAEQYRELLSWFNSRFSCSCSEYLDFCRIAAIRSGFKDLVDIQH